MQTQTDLIKNNLHNFSAMLRYSLFIMVFTFVATLSGCNENILFEENQSVNTRGWHVNDTLFFTYNLSDTTALHDLYINVRNSADYPYSNLYIFFETYFPDGRVYRDTVEMILADRFGQWTGSGFGSIKSNSFHFRRDVWFPLAGEYQFAIQHAMREESLRGISDMGIRIEKK
jgi:gliding motility-associated lipoprotein GldH